MATPEEKTANEQKVQRSILVKKRTPDRRKITALCSLMISLVEKRSSCSTLRRKLLELEELQTECKQVDKQLTHIYSEIEDEETWKKEMESQANYTEKIAETLTRTEEYLEERATGPSSSYNSASESIVHERQNRLVEFLEIPEQ